MEFLISLIETAEVENKYEKSERVFIRKFIIGFSRGIFLSDGLGEKVQKVITASPPQNICFLIKSQQFNDRKFDLRLTIELENSLFPV